MGKRQHGMDAASPPPLPFTARSSRPSHSVPPLTEICLEALAVHPEGLVDLRGIPEHLTVGLLYRIMHGAKLDYRLACVFRDAGHDPITEAINSLDLLASMPTHNALGSRGCRR